MTFAYTQHTHTHTHNLTFYRILKNISVLSIIITHFYTKNGFAEKYIIKI